MTVMSTLHRQAGGPAYGPEIRWRVVWKRLVLNLSSREVSEHLDGITDQTQALILRRFLETGGVDTWQGQGGQRPHQVFDADADIWLLCDVLDDPTATLQLRADRLLLRTGREVHVSSICRAMRRLMLSRQKVQHWAAQRDEMADAWFFLELMSFYTMEDILVIDETSKDRDVLRQSFGWSARGCPPVVDYLELSRDGRLSALCCLSCVQMEDWRFNPGTYTTESFDEAACSMITRVGADGRQPLVSRFPCILMDNASIHGGIFEQEVMAAGGRVMRIPPYLAPKRSPLDNGAFGLVVRYIQRHAQRLASMPMHAVLEEAFLSIDEPSARWCFHNCMYYSRYGQQGF